MFDQDQEEKTQFQDMTVNVDETLMRMKEIAKKIKSYFKRNFDIGAKITKRGNRITIKFDDIVVMSPREFEEKFFNFLEKLGFPIDIEDWEYRDEQAFRYGYYEGVEKIDSYDDTMQMSIYYTKALDEGAILYFVDKIVIKEIEPDEDEE